MDDIYNNMLLFIDGPLHLYIERVKGKDILAAYERLGRMVQAAAEELDKLEANHVRTR